MKILHIGTAASNPPAEGASRTIRLRDRQLTLRNALAGLGTYKLFAWQEVAEIHGNEAMQHMLVDITRRWKPDWTFAQIQRDGLFDPSIFGEIPGRVLNWMGDVREEMPQFFTRVAPFIHCMAFSNTDDVERLRAKGLRSDYLQVGFDHRVFAPNGPKDREAHEILFMASNYSGIRLPESKPRLDLTLHLRDRYGDRFGCYGRGWDAHFKTRHVTQGVEASKYRAAKIAISQSHVIAGRYSSDRLWRAMGSGVMVLSRNYPGIELEFEVGTHLQVWETHDQLDELIDYYLAHDKERERIAAAGCAHVHATSTWPERMKDFVRIMSQ